MRPNAQKPKRKGMPYKQHHSVSLPSLAHTVHPTQAGLELLLPWFGAAARFEVSC